MTELKIGDPVSFIGRDLAYIGTLISLPSGGTCQVQLGHQVRDALLEVPEELLTLYHFNINDLRDEAFKAIIDIWQNMVDDGTCRCIFCNVVASDGVPYPHKEDCIVVKIKHAGLD